MKITFKNLVDRVLSGLRLASPALVGLLGWTLVANAQTNSTPETKRPCCVEIKSSHPITDRSVYQLSSDWTTDAGKTIKLGQLRGQPQIVVMFFSSCQN